MKSLKTHTPAGALDIIPNDCFIKNGVTDKVKAVFQSFGYFEVQTPTFEFLDVFSNEETSELIKFIDRGGNLLALRHDITTPIARLAATKLKNEPLPMRLCYISTAFRDGASHAGALQREFTQAGVELLGKSSPDADAEVIALTIKTLCKTGLTDFQIDLGHAGFFKGLAEMANLSEADTAELIKLIDNKSFVGISELVGSRSLDNALKQQIIDIPNMFGGIEIISSINKSHLNEKASSALENITEVYNILCDYGYEKYVSIDLGMVQDLNYYTGIISKGYARGIGFPICGGGRYDNLVGEFGRPLSATGIAIGIERLISALTFSGCPFDLPTVNTLVCYDTARKQAFAVADALRDSGLTVELCFNQEPISYAKEKNIAGIVKIINETDTKIINTATGETVDARVSDFTGGDAI